MQVSSDRLAASGRIAAFGLAQFAVCLPGSIALYPGPYSLFSQFLSELGCAVVQDHATYYFHAWLFNLTVFCLGLCLAWFFICLTIYTSRGKTVLPVVGVCGAMASMSLACIGGIPMSLNLQFHVLAMCSWLFFMLPMSIAWFAWLAAWNKDHPYWILLHKALICAVCIYFPAGIIGHAQLWQKIVVMSSFLWMTGICLEILFICWRGEFSKLMKHELSPLSRELAQRHLERNDFRRRF